MATSFIYVLNCVNTADEETYLDIEFDTIEKLMTCVSDKYPEFTSLGIVIMPVKN